MTMLIVQIAVFVCVAATVGAVALFLNRATEPAVEDRLAVLTGTNASRQAKEALKASVLAQPLDDGTSSIASYLSRIKNVKLFFEQADTTLTPAQFLGIAAGLGLLGMCVPIFAGMHPAIVLPMGLLLASLPLVWLFMRRRSRLRKFAKQLPDALELISRALRAGHSLGSGFSLVLGRDAAPDRQGIPPHVRRAEPRRSPGRRRLRTSRIASRTSTCGSSPRPSSCNGRRAATWRKFSTRSATWSANASKSGARCRP